MGKDGVGASPATYDILDRVCENTQAEFAPQVYEAFKWGGMPETIAFACAQTCCSNRRLTSAAAKVWHPPINFS